MINMFIFITKLLWELSSGKALDFPTKDNGKKYFDMNIIEFMNEKFNKRLIKVFSPKKAKYQYSLKLSQYIFII